MDARSLRSPAPHLRAAARAWPLPLMVRLGMTVTGCLILAFQGTVPRYWPVLAVVLVWILGSTVWALRGDRSLQCMNTYLGGRTAIVDTIVVVVTIAATDEADSPLRWVLLAAPAMWASADDRRVALFAFLGGLGYLLAAVPDLVAGEPDSPRVVAEFLLTYAGAAAIALATAHARRRDAEAELEMAVAHAELVADKARDERRQREDIAVRLHDGALQMVIAARQDIDELLDGEEPDLAATRQALSWAIEGMRDLNRDLYEDVLRDRGLAAALGRAAEDTSRNGGPPVEVHVGADAGSAHDRFVLNMVNELLTNVRKHARATGASVTVERLASGWLRVRVVDDGVGLSREAARGAAADGHLGLRSIQRRIAAVGGQLEIERVDHGTSMRIDLPDAPREPDARPRLSRRAA